MTAPSRSAGQPPSRSAGLANEPPGGVEILGPAGEGVSDVLTPDALAFVAALTRSLRGRRDGLLLERSQAQARRDAGELPSFLASTRHVREGDWRVAPLPADLRDRRVEITGPVDRKMVINALNSGASCFMADFEDSSAPTWEVMVDGQRNLRDAVRGTIRHEDPTSGRVYELGEDRAVLLVRPRGLHLDEAHLHVDGRPVPGALFDFGLFAFHNAREQVARGTGPYFYLPKLESHLEARWWNDAFLLASELLGLAPGTFKATVLIETLPGAFQMEEILFELRQHMAGLNCGRWDYIFSYIKTFAEDPSRVLPDRSEIGMTQPFMRAYTQLVIKCCHRRGALAIGGMAAQIPIKRDPVANEAALGKVRADKLREVADGHDGTWVAHPGLVPLARAVFDAHMPTANQLARTRDDVTADAAALIAPPTGGRTEEGVRLNVRVGVQYLEAWLRGSGCVPLYDLMEDAATAEISRAQLWQWRRHGALLDDGRTVTAALIEQLLDEELDPIVAGLTGQRAAAARFTEARALFLELVNADQLPSFLTIHAYPRIVSLPPR